MLVFTLFCLAPPIIFGTLALILLLIFILRSILALLLALFFILSKDMTLLFILFFISARFFILGRLLILAFILHSFIHVDFRHIGFEGLIFILFFRQ